MLEGWTERSFESTVPSAAQPPARAAADNRLGNQVHKRKTSLLWRGGYPMWGGGTGAGRSRTTMQAAWHGTAERQLFHFAKCDCSPAAHTPAQPARPLARSERPLPLPPFGEVSRRCALLTLGISFLGILSAAQRWAGVRPVVRNTGLHNGLPVFNPPP